MSFHISRTLAGPFDAAVERVTSAPQQAGFGVLSDIDVAGVLKARLGLERPAYRIPGACEPDLATQALEAEPRIGVMAPCNVAALAPLADEVAGRLSRARERLA